jgi:hypothetical protein
MYNHENPGNVDHKSCSVEGGERREMRTLRSIQLNQVGPINQVYQDSFVFALCQRRNQSKWKKANGRRCHFRQKIPLFVFFRGEFDIFHQVQIYRGVEEWHKTEDLRISAIRTLPYMNAS